MKHTIDETNAHGSGSGGAHVRWLMFGARGPLLAPEPEGGAGGDGGQKPPGDKPPADPPPPSDDDDDNDDDQGEGAKRYSQADVDRIVAKRLARAERKRGPEPDPKSKKDSKPVKSEALLVTEFSDAFDDICDERGVKPGRGLKTRMRNAFLVEAPSDPDGWIESWLDDAGLKQATTTDNTKQQSSKKDEADKTEIKRDGPIKSDKGGVGGVTRDADAVLLEDPGKLTKDDIARLRLKHGRDKANAMIAERGRKYLETVKLVVDRRPQRQ